MLGKAWLGLAGPPRSARPWLPVPRLRLHCRPGASLGPRPRGKGRSLLRGGLHWGRAAVAGLNARAEGHVGGRGGVAPGSGLRLAPPPPGRTRCLPGCRSPGPALAAAPAPPGPPAPPAMGEEDYYLELCERPVHFEKANPVNCVFFDEANKQVGAGPHPPPSTAWTRGHGRPRARRGAGTSRDQPGLRPRLPVGAGTSLLRPGSPRPWAASPALRTPLSREFRGELGGQSRLLTRRLPDRMRTRGARARAVCPAWGGNRFGVSPRFLKFT